jgi:hypothetical protein
MATLTEKLRALAEKWREDAAKIADMSEAAEWRARGMKDCAAELEAALEEKETTVEMWIPARSLEVTCQTGGAVSIVADGLPLPEGSRVEVKMGEGKFVPYIVTKGVRRKEATDA